MISQRKGPRTHHDLANKKERTDDGASAAAEEQEHRQTSKRNGRRPRCLPRRRRRQLAEFLRYFVAILLFTNAFFVGQQGGSFDSAMDWIVNSTLATTMVIPKNVEICKSAFEDRIPLAPILTTPLPQNKKPFFVLHIGPSKTGTTTLQKDSVRLQDEGILASDSYVYLGRYAPRKLRYPAGIPHLMLNDDCLHQTAKIGRRTSSKYPECWKKRISGIQAHRENQTNIIVSDEHYSYSQHVTNVCNVTDYWPTIRQATFGDWNLVLVITYRRYAEWILSATKEINHKFCLDPIKEEGQWGGQRCWSVWQLISEHLQSRRGNAFGYMNVDVTALAYSGIPVRVINLHQPSHGSLTAALFCDVIPNAPNTCQALQQNGTETRENARSIMPIVYNDIVYDAFVRGLIPQQALDEKTRQQFTNELASQGAAMGLDFLDLPMVCPRRTHLETLLSKSLKLEEFILSSSSNKYNPRLRQKEHRDQFWKLANDYKAFCRVDTGLLLKDKVMWKQVIAHLQSLAGKKSFGILA